MCLQKHFALLIFRLFKAQTSDQDNTVCDYVVDLSEEKEKPSYSHSRALTVWIYRL